MSLHHLFLMAYSAAAGPDATVSFTDHAVSTSGTPYTFTSRAIGTAATGRRIIVAVSAGTANEKIPSSVTVGGNSATKVAGTDIAASTAGVSLWIVQVDTGTTANIVVTFPNTTARCGIGVWAAYDLQSNTPTDSDATTGANPVSLSIDVSAGGIVIAACSNGGSSARTCTWSGVSEDYDETISSSNCHTGGSLASSSAQTGLSTQANLSGSQTSIALCVASFR